MSNPKSWSKEKYDQFMELHQRLIRNRQQVPLEILKTKYAAAYGKITKELAELADWYATCYWEALDFPLHPKDVEGNKVLQQAIQKIHEEEKRPGGRYDRYRKALIDNLSMDDYLQLVWEIYDRCEKEAFTPYWNRHCRWTGPPENRWIYNDIFRKFWWQPKNGSASCWVDSKYQGQDMRYPPSIGPDPEGGSDKHEQTAKA